MDSVPDSRSQSSGRQRRSRAVTSEKLGLFTSLTERGWGDRARELCKRSCHEHLTDLWREHGSSGYPRLPRTRN